MKETRALCEYFPELTEGSIVSRNINLPMYLFNKKLISAISHRIESLNWSLISKKYQNLINCLSLLMCIMNLT